MDIEVNDTLPSPTDTPYRTPSSSRSRQTSGTLEDMSPGTTPPPMPEALSTPPVGRKRSNDSITGGIDESLPLSDPRRFTPTLHASLVSEILSLRRELENKTKDIDRLEQNFHSAHSQNETLNASILAANRETRQVKRQMQILEGGTLSAINEIGAERDNAVNEASELRSRLDQLQKKAKSSEQNLDRVQEQWQKDKESWNSEKRALETKVHIVEGRLKVVISEVTKAQMNSHNENADSPHRPQSRMSVLDSPSKRPASVAARRQSVTSTTSEQAGGRTSVMSFVGTGPNVNLADELALDDIEEHYDDQSEYDYGRTSPDALAEEHVRPTSSLSLKARKILGLPIDLEEFDHTHRHSLVEPLVSIVSPPGALRSIRKPANYTDSSAQYSLPPSPTKEQRDVETPVPRDFETPAPREFSPRELSPFDNARFSKALTSRSSASAAFSIDTSDNAWEELLANQPIMVSSSCQTIEQFPPPQLAPKKEGPLPTIEETTETREIAVQTEGQEPFEPSVQVTHRRNDTVETVKSSASVATADLQVPMIAIIPPTSRPVTPEDTSVQLPPRTRNQGCQVEASALAKYTSTSMQTEDIRVDKRTLIPHPTFPPPPPPALLTGPTHAISTKAKSVPYLRRGVPNTANSSMRRTNPSLGLSPINDDGPVSDSAWPDISRPVRSSSMFAGFDEADENDDLFEDDVFHDDDMFSRPTAKFVLQRGKLSQKSTTDNDESEAALAGKRFALENIRRQSEDGIPPEIKELMPGYESGSEARASKRPTKTTTKPGPSKSGNMRRTAMISSGAAAHQSRHSQSSMGSGESSRPPPMPIPVRYSSARIGKSISDGGRSSRGSSNTSPTRNVRRVMKSSLRKTRSGPALSPAGVAAKRARSRSPPLADNRVSIVPEMPQFYMPDDAESMRSAMPPNFATNYEASAPRPTIGQGPRRQTSHIKNNSDAVVPGQTSVVDAIAQTMVGEWMFKYVRRRKSFGKPDKDWDPNKSVEEMSNSASTGVRHKRWVWLAPYERSIMWSSKQPTDGTSLLGKSGRKLTIKSVLDVKDDNPMPKGAVIGTHFNRSILVLTPQRALKFTATTQDRHYIWLTALSFLSHSPITLNDLAPIPPLPQEDAQTVHSTSPAASLGGSFRRRPIRDSIRIAKNSNARSQFRSFTTDGQVNRSEYDRPPTEEAYDPVNDAALPPIIKRYHNRNRSNTAPRPPPSSFRNLLSRDSGPSTNASSAAVNYDQTSTAAGKQSSSGNPSAPSTRRSSEASAMGRPPLPNLQFLESTSNSSHAASMTMKIDAFMANAPPVGGRAPGRNMRFGLGGNGLRHQPSIRKDLGQWASDPLDQNSGGLGEPYTPTEFRFSESTGRGSSENGYFRAF